MPSVDPISGGGFAFGALVGVVIFVGSVNERFKIGMRRRASSGVDGPGDDAMMSITLISMVSGVRRRRQRYTKRPKPASLEVRAPVGMSDLCASTTRNVRRWLAEADAVAAGNREPAGDQGSINQSIKSDST